MTFVDCDISHRMALLRKSFYVTLTYFLKLEDLNLDLFTLARNCSQSRERPFLSNRLHWLPVSYRIEYKIALMTYKALKFGQPCYLADMLIHQHQVRATRSESLCRLHQPVPNSQTLSRGFRYAAPSIWNLLPPDLRKETVLTFKTCQPMNARPVVKPL